MSIRRCIQLGPYVQCTYRKETREDTVFGCTNTGCTRQDETRHGLARRICNCRSVTDVLGFHLFSRAETPSFRAGRKSSRDS
jgi:hypothetical protein